MRTAEAPGRRRPLPEVGRSTGSGPTPRPDLAAARGAVPVERVPVGPGRRW